MHPATDTGVIELLRELIQAPSYIGLARQEEKTVEVLARFLKSRGVAYSITEVRPGRPNLLATVEGKADGRHLILCGHTDTVRPNTVMTCDPFAAEMRDGKIYGRGAVDMKGAIAAMAASLVILKSGGLDAGKITLAAVVDEEMESLGAEALIQAGIQADGAIVGEPTGNRIAIGHKGLEWLEVEFIGKATHGGTQKQGISAISAASRFIRIVEEQLAPDFETRKHPVLGIPTINMGTIHGGDQPSTVAARCLIQLDRRWVPGESVTQVFQDLEEILKTVRASMPGLSTELRRVPGGMATMSHGPMEVAADHPLVRSAQVACEGVLGRHNDLTVFPAWTDAALLQREAGIPCIVWGPGDLALAHSADEWISLEELNQSVSLYTTAAIHFLSSGR